MNENGVKEAKGHFVIGPNTKRDGEFHLVFCTECATPIRVLVPNQLAHQDMIETELVKAKEKHPKFCGGFTIYDDAIQVKCPLRLAREDVERCGFKADDILDEEKLEAVESYLEGRLDDCLHELAQCGAVVRRMMEYVQAEIDAHHKRVDLFIDEKKEEVKP